jgi:hypothetical protein
MSATVVPEKTPDDSSKLKTFLSILRKYVHFNAPKKKYNLRGSTNRRSSKLLGSWV